MSKETDKLFESVEELDAFAKKVAKDVVSKNLEEKNQEGAPILVLYYDVSKMSKKQVPLLMRSAAQGLQQAIPEARVIVIPTESQESRLECINPRLAETEEAERILDLIEKVNADFQDYIRSVEQSNEENKSKENEDLQSVG